MHVSILAARLGTPWLLCSLKAFVISARTRVLHSDLVAHSLTGDVQHYFRISFFLEVRPLHHLDLLHGVGSSMTAQASILEEP